VTVIGIDDTDSRTEGMCTTFVAHTVAEELRDRGADVERILLVRLNPGVEHKTRGNAALAVHTDVDPAVASEVATTVVSDLAVVEDVETNPGVVVAHTVPDDVPDAVAEFAHCAVTDILEPGEAVSLADAHGFETHTWGNGRGIVGALAAVGAWAAFDDWTYEHITYRESDRWGSDRDVDDASVLEAADDAYPAVWDTVDRGENEVVCVPRTPCPILFGIRGDDADTCERVAGAIESEPGTSGRTFVTNQGTDVHLNDATDAPDASELEAGRAYRASGVVARNPETRRGGHVFVPFAIGGPDADRDSADGRTPDVDEAPPELELAAFEPTKRFRDHVRALHPGDAVTVCGEIADGTLKLEKFRVDDLVLASRETPECPDCGRRMKSAGADQGYRCRDCDTTAPGKVDVPLDRDLELGWYEVPPRARRHVAKPLVRGGFAGPIHPER